MAPKGFGPAVLIIPALDEEPVIGRTLAEVPRGLYQEVIVADAGSLKPHQKFGNWLATTLIRWIYGASYTDLGPFRAIRADALPRLGMRDRNYGWTIEMQIKALRCGLRVAEVPVSYRRRIGTSK